MSLPNVKIYFGRVPSVDHHKDYLSLDEIMARKIEDHNMFIESALGEALRGFASTHPEGALHTLNPQYINFLDDDYAMKNVWFITEKGEEINMGLDPVCIHKITCMGPGEVLSDDMRIFND